MPTADGSAAAAAGRVGEAVDGGETMGFAVLAFKRTAAIGGFVGNAALIGDLRCGLLHQIAHP